MSYGRGSIAYVDLEGHLIFDVRGITANNEEAALNMVADEVFEVLQGSTLEPRSRGDIREHIYFRRIRKREGHFSADAKVVMPYHTMNRKAMVHGT